MLVPVNWNQYKLSHGIFTGCPARKALTIPPPGYASMIVREASMASGKASSPGGQQAARKQLTGLAAQALVSTTVQGLGTGVKYSVTHLEDLHSSPYPWNISWKSMILLDLLCHAGVSANYCLSYLSSSPPFQAVTYSAFGLSSLYRLRQPTLLTHTYTHTQTHS